MLDADALAALEEIQIPRRFDIQFDMSGLRVVRQSQPSQKVAAQLSPYKSRGETYRRIRAALADGREYVIEFASQSTQYDAPISGAIRARDYTVNGNVLELQASSFRDTASELPAIANVHANVRGSWVSGIRYRREVVDADGNVTQPGLRVPQIGALHAIAAHWTLGKEPAIVVMPTGTGKTEVMIAATVAAQSERVLVIVPSDPLRHQTAEKFISYGWLERLGIIEQVEKPVVGVLSSKPTAAHFDALRACNIVVTTMSSVGLADEAVQAEFAGLFSHIFFDEAHHIEAATWKRFRKHCDGAHVLMFTATPFREDGKPLDGRIIYNFPLSAAQEQGYFKKINFVEVFEPNSEVADQRIADAAVAQLRADLQAGHNHMLMARASKIERAEQLLANVYAQYGDLNPVVIHSRTPSKASVLQAIRRGEHKIVVCVDMFGEGFDLPNLKIAALHDVHKSLGITLQYIGRFARSAADVSAATFVANTAEDGVPESLENLYREDADWNELLAGLSFDAINPQAQLSDLVSHLEDMGVQDKPIEISTVALKPKISAQVYRTTAFYPDRYTRAFRPKQKIHQPQISRQDNFLVLVVNQKESLDWTDSVDIATDVWDLYIAYYDPEKQLLYVHCSRKGTVASTFAEAVSEAPELIQGETTFKSFANLSRLILHSVGLSSRSKNVRYQMFAGLDVRTAIDPILQQDKMKSNVTGVGYEAGKRKTVGCSKKGKIWAMSSGSLAQWKSWCDSIGVKLSGNAEPNDFLRYTLIPSAIDTLPVVPALMIDWPDQLFEFANFKFQMNLPGGRSFDFHDCQLELRSWPEAGGLTFQFALIAGTDVETVLELAIVPPDANNRESSYEITRVSGEAAVEIDAAGQKWDAVAFFKANPPLVRLSDGSQLSGNILLKPRDELADTYERDRMMVLDWQGVDLQVESRWRNGVYRANSVQQRFIEQLEEGNYTFIFDDDDTGESADVVSIEETQQEIIVTLWHCKYAGGDAPGQRAKDLYEVCGQAEKSTKWTWSLENLVKHLIVRESKHKRGRASRFIRGSTAELVTMRKSARKKFVVFKIGIVQPGLSRANVPAEHLAIIGSTNSFVQTITDSPLTVVCSE